MPPTLPPDVPQVFLPPTTAFEWALHTYEEQTGQAVLAQERHLVYTPHLLAMGNVRLLDRKRGVDHRGDVARLVRLGEGIVGVDWQAGEAVVCEGDLSSSPPGEGLYAPVPAELVRPRDLSRLAKDFADYLYYSQTISILYNPALDLYGEVGESRRDFRVRCEEEVQRQRDAELKKARARVEREIEGVERKMRREERELKKDEEELTARKWEERIGLGESALNILTGRRASRTLSYASRRRTMTQKAEAEVEESVEAIEDLEAQIGTLEEEWKEQAAEIADQWADKLEGIEEFEVSPRRADVAVTFCGLAWVPAWRVTLTDGQQLELPARE